MQTKTPTPFLILHTKLKWLATEDKYEMKYSVILRISGEKLNFMFVFFINLVEKINNIYKI